MLWKLALVAALAAGAIAMLQRDKLEEQAKAGIGMLCQHNNAANSIPQAQQAISSFRSCVEKLIDVDNIVAEVQAAQPTGDLDVVFKKYCGRTGQLKSCIDAATTGVGPCVPAPYNNLVPVVTNTTITLLDYFCFNNGDRMALFIAEEGPQCVKSNTKEMQKCFAELRMATFFSIDIAQRCKLFDRMAACAVATLEHCKNKTPSTMVDAMFKFFRQSSPCPPVKN